MNSQMLVQKNFDVEATLAFWLQDLETEKKAFKLEFESFYLKRNDFVEFFRKIGVRLGMTHDYRSASQFDAARTITALRRDCFQKTGRSLPSADTRWLLRVDDFPAKAADSGKFLEFHERAADFGVPYLLAVTPFLNGAPGLRDREIEILRRCVGEGAEIALHGFTHRSAQARPKSELNGMGDNELREKITVAKKYFENLGLSACAFVAPFNHYDAGTFRILASEFPVLCGGPESIDALGAPAGPCFIHESLYVPSYRGGYDGFEIVNCEENHLQQPAHLPVPLTLHWTNGLRGPGFLDLFKKIRGLTVSWNDFAENAKKIKKRSHAV